MWFTLHSSAERREVRPRLGEGNAKAMQTQTAHVKEGVVCGCKQQGVERTRYVVILGGVI
jgi:hypothetical protein